MHDATEFEIVDERHISRSYAMSPLRTLAPLHRRFIYFLIGQTTIMFVWSIELAREEREYRNLAGEVSEAGGQLCHVSFLRNQWLPSPLDHVFAERTTLVLLRGNRINGEWLLRHDDLTSERIDRLIVRDGVLSATDVVRLVDRHPITALEICTVPDADYIARTLMKSHTLKTVQFIDCDLTDAGFGTLPLERMHGISVVGSAVTPHGLRELRRCSQLEWADLDGPQFDDSVAQLLCDDLKIRSLGLNGKQVTDEHLTQIHGTSLLRVSLFETSTTIKGVRALRQAMPQCRICVY